MTVARARGSKARADKLFSQIIKHRAGYRCEHCHKPTGEVQLQTAHIYSRRYPGTRCDLDNAFCLCAACHRMFTDRPVRFATFVGKHRSFLRVIELDRKSEPGTKVDWDAVVAELTLVWLDMNPDEAA